MKRLTGYLLGGVVLATLLCLVAAAAAIGLAPRTIEGGRSIVALSWPLFASLPIIVAGAIALSIGLFLPGQARHRIAFVIGTAIGLFLTSGCCLDILRRDYIGKF
jgi:hypothetical protein